jgi:hypothetical protein
MRSLDICLGRLLEANPSPPSRGPRGGPAATKNNNKNNNNAAAKKQRDLHAFHIVGE